MQESVSSRIVASGIASAVAVAVVSNIIVLASSLLAVPHVSLAYGPRRFPWQKTLSRYRYGCGLTPMSPRRRTVDRQRSVLHCKHGADLEAIEVGSDVQELGVKFWSLPPGKVIVKDVSVGTWAARQGIQIGSELVYMNGLRVATMSRDAFKKMMQGHPTCMQITMDPRLLTQDITMTSSASSLLSLIGPWLYRDTFNMIHMGAAFYRLALYKHDIDTTITSSSTFKRLIELAKSALEDGVADGFVREISNIFWAVATLREHINCFRDLVPALCEAVKQNGQSMSRQDISNDLWAVATLRREVPIVLELTPLLVSGATEKAQGMIPQQISNVAWATGVLRLNGGGVRGMLVAVCKATSSDLREFNPRDLAHICWALAAYDVREEALIQSIAARVVEDAMTWGRKQQIYDLTTVVAAHATLDLVDTDLLDVTASTLSIAMDELPDWNLCALLWSFIKLDRNRIHDDFRQQLIVEVAKRGIDAASVSRSRLGPEEWFSRP